jgi:hypothetical protein
MSLMSKQENQELKMESLEWQLEDSKPKLDRDRMLSAYKQQVV